MADYPKDPYCSIVHPDYIENRIVEDSEGRRIVPTPTVRCRRIKHHDGPHSAFTYLISQPETW